MSKYTLAFWILVTAFAVYIFSVGVSHAAPVPLPWWYSTDPSRVGVDPNVGVLTANGKGTATICKQVSKFNPKVLQCFSVTVVKVGP